MAEVLRRLGCDVVRADDRSPMARRASGRSPSTCPRSPAHEADYDLVRRLRASICVLGPLLARCGLRPGRAPRRRRDRLARAGHARRRPDRGWAPRSPASTASSSPRRRTGCTAPTIWLDFPSVGATENLLMAAVLAEGVTEIDNAAREPEIVDICAMLTEMGAQIAGAGTSTLDHRGRRRAAAGRHRTVGDRIVAGTWAFGAAMTRGDVTVHRGRPGASWRSRWTSWSPPGGQVETRRDALPGPDGRPAARGRRRHAAVSRASPPTCCRWRSGWPRSARAPR